MTRDAALDEQVGPLALGGDVAEADGTPSIHTHVVLGTRDGMRAEGVMLGRVRPTAEHILDTVPGASSHVSPRSHARATPRTAPTATPWIQPRQHSRLVPTPSPSDVR
jgi:predicted DNA-binding protein with PD1-like motif